jgi:hypothetical protein
MFFIKFYFLFSKINKNEKKHFDTIARTRNCGKMHGKPQWKNFFLRNFHSKKHKCLFNTNFNIFYLKFKKFQTETANRSFNE